MPGSSLPRPYIIATIFVCIAATAVGAFFGSWFAAQTIVFPLLYNAKDSAEMQSAMALTQAPSRQVMLIGALGGLLAGLSWSYMMLRHTRKGNVSMGKGVLWGIAVGVIDTLFLHRLGHFIARAVLPGEFGDWTGWLVPGLFFGVIAGAVAGLICGIVWVSVAEKHPLAAASQE